jgi:hypothetical protein
MEHFNQRAVADADVSEIDASTHRHDSSACLDRPAQLIDETRLADTSIAPDEHQLRPLSCSHRCALRMTQLEFAADKCRTRHPFRHRSSMDQPLSAQRQADCSTSMA